MAETIGNHPRYHYKTMQYLKKNNRAFAIWDQHIQETSMTFPALRLEEPRRLSQSTPERQESRNLSDIQGKQMKTGYKTTETENKTIFNGFFAFFLIY